MGRQVNESKRGTQMNSHQLLTGYGKACADRGRLAEQNRELAAALDRCVRELDAAYYGISTLPADHFGRLAVEEARAVLAKVTA